MDGLRFGSSPPRQIRPKRILEARSESNEGAEALPLARLRPPAFAGLRDHDRTIGLALRFRLAAAPLHAPIEHLQLHPTIPI